MVNIILLFLKDVNFFLHFILDWESQLKLKASTPAQDILEENSSYNTHVVRFVGDRPLFPLIEAVRNS